MAGDHRRAGAGEKDDCRRDVFRLGEASQRRHRLDLRDEGRIGGQRRDKWRSHIGRRHGIDANTAGRPFDGEGAGHVHDGTLGRLVGNVRVEAAARKAHDRRDIDDRPAAAARHHVTGGDAAGKERAGHIDGDDLVPVGDRVHRGTADQAEPAATVGVQGPSAGSASSMPGQGGMVIATNARPSRPRRETETPFRPEWSAPSPARAVRLALRPPTSARCRPTTTFPSTCRCATARANRPGGMNATSSSPPRSTAGALPFLSVMVSMRAQRIGLEGSVAGIGKRLSGCIEHATGYWRGDPRPAGDHVTRA